MNKYQEFIFKSIRASIATENDFDRNSPLLDFLDDSGNLVITQDENYNIKKRNMLLATCSIKYVELDGKKLEPINDEKNKLNHCVVIPFDFDNRITKVKFYFINDIAEPLEITVSYKEIDHSIYDSKVQEELNAQIKPEHKTGSDLVNIYWNLVSDKVEETKIILYSVTNGVERLIAKYKETEAMFKSITGLAFGKYVYEIIEYDKNGNEIARTPKISFSISQPNYSGRHTVVI